MNKPTITAAIIEANCVKNPDQPVIDYEYRAACMDVLIDAARFREKREAFCVRGDLWRIRGECPNCHFAVFKPGDFCYNCGQALDWGTE